MKAVVGIAHMGITKKQTDKNAIITNFVCCANLTARGGQHFAGFLDQIHSPSAVNGIVKRIACATMGFQAQL